MCRVFIVLLRHILTTLTFCNHWLFQRTSHIEQKLGKIGIQPSFANRFLPGSQYLIPWLRERGNRQWGRSVSIVKWNQVEIMWCRPTSCVSIHTTGSDCIQLRRQVTAACFWTVPTAFRWPVYCFTRASRCGSYVFNFYQSIKSSEAVSIDPVVLTVQ